MAKKDGMVNSTGKFVDRGVKMSLPFILYPLAGKPANYYCRSVEIHFFPVEFNMNLTRAESTSTLTLNVEPNYMDTARCSVFRNVSHYKVEQNLTKLHLPEKASLTSTKRNCDRKNYL